MSNTTRSTNELVSKYLNSYDGKRLMESFDMSSSGVWLVQGEGDDRGYNAHEIGYFTGNLQDVISMAVHNKHWGYGGSITPITIHTITEYHEHKERLKRDRDALLAQVAQLDEQLVK